MAEALVREEIFSAAAVTYANATLLFVSLLTSLTGMGGWSEWVIKHCVKNTRGLIVASAFQFKVDGREPHTLRGSIKRSYSLCCVFI